MTAALCKAYEDALWMLDDGIRKVSDAQWRQGPDDYLVTARIAYHIMKSFEWLTNDLPREEFMAARKYKLDWLGPVDPMPGRAEMLADIPCFQQKITFWLEKLDSTSKEGQEQVGKALYYLRHIQHHIGEFSIIARLIHCDCPEWK